jgi:maltooligosyltrehalose trehalohydrolase
VPDPQARATFERSKLNWEEAGKGEHAAMLAWYAQMISLRRRLGVVSQGRREQVQASFDQDAGWLVVVRGSVVVVANLGSSVVRLPVPSVLTRAKVVASSSPSVSLGGGFVEVPPDAVVVLTESTAT